MQNDIKSEAKELGIVHQAINHKIDALNERSEILDNDISDIKKQLSQMLEAQEIDYEPCATLDCITDGDTESICDSDVDDWASALQDAKSYLQSNNVSICSNIYELLTPQQLSEIDAYLSSPVFERVPWDKWDYIFAFGAGIVGSLIDIFMGTPGFGLQKALSDKNTKLGAWMENIHKYHHQKYSPSPIDFREGNCSGDGNTWAYHRGASSGHDIFRFISGLKQVMNGEYKGIFYKDGTAWELISSTTPSNIAYPKLSLSDALVQYTVHLLCDFFSSTSLPIPGTTWLFQMDNRAVRKFVMQELYQKGFNLRHVCLQTLAPAIIQLILSIYLAIRYKDLRDDEAVKYKRSEIVLLGHSICMASNMGKILITKDIKQINVPQLIMTTKSFVSFSIKRNRRVGTKAIINRNTEYLKNDLLEIESQIETSLPVIEL